MLDYSILGTPLLEWIGYAASVFVLVSLTMTSIVKLRWYNMVGGALFSTYGFLIGSYPVAIMNFLLVCANIYNLMKIYQRKEDFQLFQIKDNRELLNHFLDFYAKDIAVYYPNFKIKENQIAMFVLRDMAIAGIFIGTVEENNLYIDLDYALPQYRDNKLGIYLYQKLYIALKDKQINTVYCSTDNDINNKYLLKMGFTTCEINGEPMLKKSLS